jgi:hypothetical protein
MHDKFHPNQLGASMPQTRFLITGAVLACATASAAQAAVVISSAATAHMDCSAGVCAPTAADATLNVGDLENLLASGAVKVTTTGSGVQAHDIEISAPLSWSAASMLALDSYHSITINRTVSVDGQGGLAVTTDDGGSGGSLAFGRKGHAIFQNLSSPLTINGASYTLVNSVQSLASAVSSDPTGSYALADNYDASQDGEYSASPIQTELTGTFEGLGNSISHLSISPSTDAYVGLFSFADGTIENLEILDASLSVKDGSIAGILSAEGYGGYITRVEVTGVIRGSGSRGNTIGGLSGGGSTIFQCHANVRITDDQPEGSAGGLVNTNGGTISESYATGSVVGPASDYVIGGLSAMNDGTIQNSYATASAKGGVHSWIGGLVGTNGKGKIEPGIIETSYSMGKVIAKYPSRAGGFAGVAYSDRGRSLVQQSYWDTTTSGTSKAVGKGGKHGVSGLTSNQFQSGLPAGFDPKIWAESPNINNGLPYLINNPPEK